MAAREREGAARLRGEKGVADRAELAASKPGAAGVSAGLGNHRPCTGAAAPVVATG